MLRPIDVRIDDERQRSLNMRHVADLAQKFNPALFGMGQVSKRPDGYYVVDSQHRCLAAIMAGYGEHEFPFRVWRDLTPRDEAAKFLEFQEGKKNPTPIEVFRMRVASEDPIALDIVRVLSSFGLAFGASMSDGRIAAVTTLIDLWNGRTSPTKGPPVRQFPELPQSQLLSRTLQILVDAWQRDRSAFDRLLLTGIAALLLKHGTAVDGKRLAKALSKECNASMAIGKIKSHQQFARVSGTTAALEWLEGLYNRKLKNGTRLER